MLIADARIIPRLQMLFFDDVELPLSRSAVASLQGCPSKPMRLAAFGCEDVLSLYDSCSTRVSSRLRKRSGLCATRLGLLVSYSTLASKARRRRAILYASCG